MIYSLLVFQDNKDASPLIDALGVALNKLGSKINVTTLDINAIQNDCSAALELSKRAHAIVYAGDLKNISHSAKTFLARTCAYNQLYACITRYTNAQNQLDLRIVCDVAGGLQHGESGFRNNDTFGREAFDTESYSELEIERALRVAYDVAMQASRRLTLANMPSNLATASLWRKLLADLNEDYPYVSADAIDATTALKLLVKNPCTLSTIACNSLIGAHLNAVASAITPCDYAQVVGNTPLALYAYTPSNDISALLEQILTHSLGGQI